MDKLGGGDQHSIKLAKARDQSRKSQGPVGLLQVHWVFRRRDPYKLIYSIRDQLDNMDTHLSQDGIDQLTLQ